MLAKVQQFDLRILCQGDPHSYQLIENET
jgi:hypothetical protein